MPLILCRLVASCLVAVLGTAPVIAQSQAPPVFRAEAHLVEVIVRVTDKEGRFVPDLAQADFALEDEGRPQTIVAFNTVEIPRHSVATRHMTAPAPTMSTVSTNIGADETRLFVLVLDDMLTSASFTIPVRRFARDFIERFVAG